jgi:hypothetical protein
VFRANPENMLTNKKRGINPALEAKSKTLVQVEGTAEK